MGTIGGLGVLHTGATRTRMIINDDGLYIAVCPACMGVFATEVSKLSSAVPTAEAPSFQAVERLTIQPFLPDFLPLSAPPSPEAYRHSGFNRSVRCIL